MDRLHTVTWRLFVDGFLPGGLFVEQPPEVEDAKISLHEMFASARDQAALRFGVVGSGF